MTDYSRIRRQQLVREAEGYLELAGMFADRWPLSQPLRDRLAQRAIETLSNATTNRAQLAHVLMLRGQALRVMERYEDAVEPLQQAAELEPENVSVWLALGWCFKRIGRLDLAIESLESALRADDQEAIVHYNLACYWSLSGNVAVAVTHLSLAFEIDPSFRERVASESDFEPIRLDPRFHALMNSVIV